MNLVLSNFLKIDLPRLNLSGLMNLLTHSSLNLNGRMQKNGKPANKFAGKSNEEEKEKEESMKLNEVYLQSNYLPFKYT